MWLTRISIHRPLLILMALFAVMLGGIVSYTTLGVDLLPSVKFPYVAVIVTYPGAGPSEVESRITKPIENAVAGSTGIKHLSSSSGEAFSMTLLEFKDGIDPEAAAQDVERRVDQIRADLPEDALEPVIWKFDPAGEPVIVAGASWEDNPDGLFKLADDVIRPRLEAVDGVASVEIQGGRQQEIHVAVDRDRLEAHSLSLSQITAALAAANLSAPSGYVQEGAREYSLRVYGLYQELDQLSNLVVAAPPGRGIIRLRDVATVENGFKKPTYVSRANGTEGVAILIQKQQTANTVAVTAGVHKQFLELESVLAPGVRITTVMENAQFVRESLNGLQGSLRDSVLIVALVLLLFLHTWRSTLIVLVSIPTSLIATFGMMWVMGFSINMMTMMAMALTVGILVDDSIVILENIHRHMKLGESPWTAALNGRAEIGAAAVAITLVDVVVYTPVAFLTGMVGQFFREFGLTITAATLFSLLVSFTLTPLLASRWMAATDEERSPLAPLWRRWEDGYQALAGAYRRLLARALDHRWQVLAIGLTAFVAGIALVAFGVVKTEFLTPTDQGQFSVAVDLPHGTPLAGTNEEIQTLERELAKLPEIQSFISSVGVGGQYGRPQHRSARIYVRLKPLSERSRDVFKVADDVRRLASSIPGAQARIDLPSIVGYIGQPIMIRIRGTDSAGLSDLASRVEEIVSRTPGTVDVYNSSATGAPEMRVEIDQQRVSDLGLTTAQVAQSLRTAYEGTVATEWRRENEDKVDIRVLYASTSDGSDLSTLLNLPLATPRGTQIRLGQVARLVPAEGPPEIEREERMRQIVIGANLAGRPMGQVVGDIQQSLKAVTMPPGYSIVWAGDAELQDEAFSSLLKALAISVILIYMLLVALFDSLVYPLVIMGSLPVASVGAIGALALTGDTLNIMSMVGFIMLTGLVAKNAILLVDFTNTLRKRGRSRRDALLEAGPIRLRPILMTTSAMVFAMMPLAMKVGEGAVTRAPLAIAVIGGLLTSTLLTLVVVPAGYTIMDDFQEWVRARLGPKGQAGRKSVERPLEKEAAPR